MPKRPTLTTRPHVVEFLSNSGRGTGGPYIDHELPHASKSTRMSNKNYIKNWVEPAWHDHAANGMRTMEIESWLHSIPRPDGTKLKIKGVMSTIVSHGVRWELVDRNPVCGQGGMPGHRGASTGVRQSGKSSIRRVVLPPDAVRQVIEKITGLKSSKQAPIGWHTLRRSLATLLISNGENVKVVQSQLRHTTPKITLELYAQTVSADQHKAHAKVVKMMLPKKLPQKLKAMKATAAG